MTDSEFYVLAAKCSLTGMDADDNSLEHHGIKGQHWGQRRFQNPDGSLTAAGKKRYGYSSFEEKKKEWAKDPKKVYKHRKVFSAEEIEKAAQKQVAQNELKDALSEEKKAKKLEKVQRREEKESIRQAKAAEDIERLRIKSEERMHKVTEDTKVALQKQRDDAQKKREAIAREQKKLEESKKGKTLLVRLQKTDKLGKAFFGNFETAQKYFKSIGKEKEFNNWWRQLFGQPPVP